VLRVLWSAAVLVVLVAGALGGFVFAGALQVVVAHCAAGALGVAVDVVVAVALVAVIRPGAGAPLLYYIKLFGRAGPEPAPHSYII